MAAPFARAASGAETRSLAPISVATGFAPEIDRERTQSGRPRLARAERRDRHAVDEKSGGREERRIVQSLAGRLHQEFSEAPRKAHARSRAR